MVEEKALNIGRKPHQDLPLQGNRAAHQECITSTYSLNNHQDGSAHREVPIKTLQFMKAANSSRCSLMKIRKAWEIATMRIWKKLPGAAQIWWDTADDISQTSLAARFTVSIWHIGYLPLQRGTLAPQLTIWDPWLWAAKWWWIMSIRSNKAWRVHCYQMWCRFRPGIALKTTRLVKPTITPDQRVISSNSRRSPCACIPQR